MKPEIGAPITPLSAAPAMKMPSTRPRYAVGYQSVRKNSTPGKNPASAMPSSSRRQ